MPTLTAFPSGLAMARRELLRRRGVSNDRIRTAIRAGRWQEPVRGVVVPHAGALTQQERWQIALEYAGPQAALSHHSALRLWGARAEELAVAPSVAGVAGQFAAPPEGGLVEVSLPHGRHLSSHGFVVVHQTRRPLGTLQPGGLRATSPARAVVDVCLTATRRADVDHAVSDALQRGLTTVEQLLVEAEYAEPVMTPWLRGALDDARRGMRSVGESDLRRVVVAAGLPEPEWGAEIVTPEGTFFVDALWRSRRVAAEADGRAYHLGVQQWQDDLRRQNAIHGAGVVLLRFPVRRLREHGDACGAQLARLVS